MKALKEMIRKWIIERETKLSVKRYSEYWDSLTEDQQDKAIKDMTV